ncbi:Enoyl-CoA delta isomerase 1, mitochondrial [Trichoplax sp. H2]|nr:Enoyl-CoA delta isomerase 1, mitochondrial [Trichoplax sp. H2]|eukprot:RDD40599.1 Enoyl-CoA delta isomerase 1, mitochondrial [Trichoplax sp. H2]
MALARAVTGVSGARRLLQSLPSCLLAANRTMSSGSSANLNVDIQDDVATIRMARSPGNALDISFFQEIHNALNEVENSCRGIILTSDLPQIFSAGLNLKAVAQLSSVAELDEFVQEMEKFWLRIYSSKLATVAAINGHATAAGCALALACDYRVMAKGDEKPYMIGLNESKLGLKVTFWLLEAYKDAVGNRNADLHVQLGTLFPEVVAAKLGLVDQLVSKEELLPEAQKRMKEFLSVPDHSRYGCKLLLRRKVLDHYSQFGAKERQQFIETLASPKTQELIKEMMMKLSKSRK